MVRSHSELAYSIEERLEPKLDYDFFRFNETIRNIAMLLPDDGQFWP